MIHYLIDVLVLILIYILVAYPFFKVHSTSKFILLNLLYLYFCTLIALTLMPIVTSLPRIFNTTPRPMNLVPFIDILLGRGEPFTETFLNILLMVPLGFLLPMVSKQSLLKILFTAIFISLAIELIQPIINTARIGDITDIINNSIGSLVGYGLFKIIPKKKSS